MSGELILIVEDNDAMTSTRPYGQAPTYNQALNEFNRQAGSLFNPLVVTPLTLVWDKGLIKT